MYKKTVLLTGASGFIGSHTAEQILADEGYRLVAIVRKAQHHKIAEHLKRQGATLIEGAFYDPATLDRAFAAAPIEFVIHCAAVRGIGAASCSDYRRINVDGTETLLGAALTHAVNKFIFCSTAGVYGTTPAHAPASLASPLHGDNAYHRSKIEAEALVGDYITKGLDAFIVRPPITYGKGDTGFPAMLVRLVRRRMMLLPVRDISVHLLDVTVLADIFAALLKKSPLPRRVFIAADASPILLHELVDLIYHYYYQKPYPAFLTVPSCIFRSLHLFSTAVRSERWSARAQLMCQDWYYDTSDTFSVLGVDPADTKRGFRRFLRETNDCVWRSDGRMEALP